MNISRIDQFNDRFPNLAETLGILNAYSIEWMIAGSGCLFLLGNDRLPDDVDIFLKDDQHDMADKLFGIESFIYSSNLEEVRNSNPGGSHSIQLTSHLKIKGESKYYDMRISQSVLDNRVKLGTESEKIFLMPPEDVLLIKALLQRGEDVGKHDVADIHSFMKIHKINFDYLKKRILSIGAEQRVGKIFDI